MSKAEPTIKKFMTTQPQSIDSSKTIEEARRLMINLGIRHLPVMKGGKVHGILTDRDIKLALSFKVINAEKTMVEDICVEDPYQVSPDTPLHEVVTEMAKKRYGSAIVTDDEFLVGIFTTVDACRALADILETRFHTH